MATNPVLFTEIEHRFPQGGRLEVAFSIPLRIPSTTVVFGPSGSGKSTLLHCLAGIETPDAGHIRFGDLTWFDHAKKLNRLPRERSVGLLFQDAPLFPHLSLSKNIGFGLQGLPDTDRKKQINASIRLWGLEGKDNRYPDELSGGERQRAALAQILAAKPKLLLLDEPFSALDLQARSDLQIKLRHWIHETKGHALLVTHDLAEALAFGDRFIILSEGRILQEGRPMEIFSRPALPAVAKIVGIENLIPGRVSAAQEGIMTLDLGKTQLVAGGSIPLQQSCFAAFRAEEVILEKGAGAQSSARNRLSGIVLEILPHGPQTKVRIDCGFPLTAAITPQSVHGLSLKPGSEVVAVIKASAIHVLLAP